MCCLCPFLHKINALDEKLELLSTSMSMKHTIVWEYEHYEEIKSQKQKSCSSMDNVIEENERNEETKLVAIAKNEAYLKEQEVM